MSIGSALNRNGLPRIRQSKQAKQPKQSKQPGKAPAPVAPPTEPPPPPAEPPPVGPATTEAATSEAATTDSATTEAAATDSATDPSPAGSLSAPPAVRPAYAPMITDAPGLNWAGPGDAWSRAWGAHPPQAAALPAAALSGADSFRTTIGPRPTLFPPMPDGPPIPVAPPALIANTAVAVLPLGSARTAATGPTAEDIALVRRSLGVLEPVADRATAHFYAVLFLRHPELRALFPASMDLQRDRLFRALLAAGQAADDPPALSAYLDRLARGHRKYGVLNEHYGPVGEALLAALERYCGRYWDQPTEIAWRRIYRAITEVMIASATDDAAKAPAWWQAEVLTVDQVSSDIALVALRTDQPYPYRAGQYTTLEVPMWPRVWRQYSMASAPRPDSPLALQVKAVPAGWVSNALAHRTRPGDLLRLGPPAGTMVVDHASDTPLLLLGGGTGIAPLLAIVEEVAAHGRRRTVEVFYGARRAADLYAREQLLALARQHPWLAVRSVVSEGAPVDSGPTGTLPAVVGRRGPWEEYEAYVSGPPAMIRRTSAVLVEAGVPGERIHHDLPEELG
ncbi:globin domain-containing protein [Streptacidiphilus sp. N1-12]|uniref:Globin domain-containing protein n=2 Tax=Streptacidiphilus alkalitolerans TaxID=3342712 RepID=A0ABV6WEU2_9ACTN